MDFKEVVKKRRTVRKYTSEDVSVERIKEVLEEAVWSPSACNRQPWYFVIVKNPELKQKIASMAFNLPQMRNASAILAVFSDLEKYCDSSTRKQVEENKYYHIDAGVVLQTISLSAFDKGLGTCIVAGRLPKKEIRETLGVPDNYALCALMSFGVPDGEAPVAPERDSTEKYFDVDEYSPENKSRKGKTDQSAWSQVTGKIKKHFLKH
ncbi:MAG: nitroreductase family protein [Candidatus Micrarchaeota archaeon]